VRILLVSQMYPGTAAPDLGTFVRDLEQALTRRGHEIARAVVDRRGGRSRHVALARDVLVSSRRFRPQVVYAHFLVPAAFLAAVETRAPLVVTAHGQDVENARVHAGVRAATRRVVRRAHSVIAVSDWLRRRLEDVAPEARGKSHVIDCGVDLVRFAPGDQVEARTRVRWAPSGTGFLCVGALIERKNVLLLARAFERRAEGSLAFVGSGPLRPALEGRHGIHVAGAVPHERIPDWISAADVVCQPSLAEPFGLVTLEAMAAGRSVVATRVGGPAEFVTDGAGVLVDPTDEDAVVAALETATTLPKPNEAGRAAAATHAVERQAARIEELLVRAAS
jgi:glycosyltransferase involved in cell wall biosynthesis